MIVGPSWYGKTALTEALVTERSVFQGKLRPCHYCCGAVWQPRFDGMKKRGIRFRPNVPDIEDFQRCFATTHSGVLVLDDLMEEAGNDKRVMDLFTKESNHRGITLMYL